MPFIRYFNCFFYFIQKKFMFAFRIRILSRTDPLPRRPSTISSTSRPSPRSCRSRISVALARQSTRICSTKTRAKGLVPLYPLVLQEAVQKQTLAGPPVRQVPMEQAPKSTRPTRAPCGHRKRPSTSASRKNSRAITRPTRSTSPQRAKSARPTTTRQIRL